MMTQNLVSLRMAAGWMLSALMLLTACDDSPTDGDGAGDFTFSFENGAQGWTGDFADYPTTKSSEELELVFERAALPEELDESERALFLAGRNESDDLFMYLRREIRGLEPNTAYDVTYRLEIASNAPSGCVGIGGPPGEAVVVKVGVATVEPVPVVENGDYRLNVDKDAGEETTTPQSSVRVIGNIANGTDECTGEVPYRMITLANSGNPLEITTDEQGSLWLFVGTDSGFEGKTALYYDVISVTINPA